MNTVASRDQFKLVRIGENLMPNYNERYGAAELPRFNRVQTKGDVLRQIIHGSHCYFPREYNKAFIGYHYYEISG